MKSINNRTEKKYLLLVFLAFIIIVSCIFSWCNVMRVNTIKGTGLVYTLFDITLLAFLSIICVKIFIFTIMQIYSYFLTFENMNNEDRYNKIKLDGRSYIEVKYKQQKNNMPLKFYSRRIGINKICLLAENEYGVILYKEYISYDYFLEHFYYP